MPPPELSIVIASQGSAQETRCCLLSLLEQQDVTQEQIELLVPEGPPHRVIEQLKDEFSRVLFLKATATSLPLLHGIGIANASGKLIGITEGHCTFPHDWAAATIRAHNQSSAGVIGGAVAPGPQLTDKDLALFLCDYVQFMPPITAQKTSDLPGNNVVFKRKCLGQTSEFIKKGFWKTFYCKDLERSGAELISEPSMQVFYNRHLEWNELLKRRFDHGRCFGSMRADKCSPAERLLYGLAGPGLPFLLFNKLWDRTAVNSQSRALLGEHMPTVLAILIAWVQGEWVGNLFGDGGSCGRL